MRYLFQRLSFMAGTLLASMGNATPLPTGHWSGMVSHRGKEWKIALDIINAQKALVDFIDIGVYRREFDITGKGDSIYLRRPQPGGAFAVFAGRQDVDTLSGSWMGAGIEDARFVLYRTAPLVFHQEEIGFQNGAAKLSGTLLVPEGKPPFPVIVFMHGGADEDRNTYYGPALKFLKAGFAALIYDKRGVGRSIGGDWRQDGLTALADDALAGVKVLKSRADIDPSRIALFGHSEGGWTAPIAASRSSDIAYLIVSGASSIPASRQTIYHRSNVMRENGFDAGTIGLATQLWQNAYDAAKTCLGDSARGHVLKAEAAARIDSMHTQPWFAAAGFSYPYPPDCPSSGVMEVLFRDPLETWSKVKIPVLAIWGERDIVVPVQSSSAAIEAALLNAGNKDATIRIMPGVDHGFLKHSDNKEWDFPRQSGEYFGLMVDWLAPKAETGNNNFIHSISKK